MASLGRGDGHFLLLQPESLRPVHTKAFNEFFGMNILHIFGTYAALQSWLMSDIEIAGTNFTRSVGNGRGHVQVDDVRFTCVQIQELHDTDMVRGNRFDMLIFHDSFGRNLHRIGRHSQMGPIVSTLNAYCLRK